MALTDAQKAQLNGMCHAAKDAALGTVLGELQAGAVSATVDNATVELAGTPAKLRLKDGGVSAAKLAAPLQALLLGVAADYVVARGEAAVTGTADVDTGLGTVVAVVACLKADPSLDALWVSAAPGATAGHVDLKVWKPTAAADCTPLAATAEKAVLWIAIGTGEEA